MTKKHNTRIAALITLFMTVLLICNLSAVFAAADLPFTGGTLLENSGKVTIDDYFCTHLEGIKNPNYDYTKTTATNAEGWINGTITTGGGTYSNAFYKVANGSGPESIAVKYPSYLIVGSKYYDLVLKIKKLSIEKSKGLMVIHPYQPRIALNYGSGFDPAITMPDKNGYIDVEFEIDIFEAGTDTKANINNIYLGILDLDASKYTEALNINGFTPSESNTWMMENMKGYTKVNGNTFIGNQENENLINCYIKPANLSQSGELSGYYGWDLNGGAYAIMFYSTKFNVNYVAGTGGSVSRSSESVFDKNNPLGSTATPNSGYYLNKWTVDKAVKLENGTEIPAGGTITESQIKTVIVDKDLTFTASFSPYLNVKYEWNNPNPGTTLAPLPKGKNDIKSGDTYKVSSHIGDYVSGKKIEDTGGTWEFVGWDNKQDTLTITSNTVIKGTWKYADDVNVTYAWKDNKHPNVDPPKGVSGIKAGTEYTPQKGYTPSEVEGTYQNKEGLFTFKEWDKTEPFNVNEDTTIYGTWDFTEYVKATYKWKDNKAPESAVLPANKEKILKGDSYTISDKYTSPDEKEIVEPYQGKNGYWTFIGWDPNGTLEMNENKTIEGTWEFTPNVSVKYEWADDDHPTVDPPKGEPDIRKGSTHTVDTSFIGKEIVEPKGDISGYWKFDGWDEKRENITVNEDTVITGTWTFVPDVSVKYEWKDDKHPDIDPPKPISGIKKGEEYTPEQGFEPSEVEGEYEDKEGLFTFKEWDKTEPFNVEEDTTIYGTWDFTEYVKASYKWKDNKAPESAVLPDDKGKILKGDSYTVSDKYTSPDEREIVEPYQGKNGYWTFMGWDPNGTIEMDENKEIEGTWEFTPNVSVKYEWADDDHPNVEPPKGEPDIRKGSTHVVDTTFKKGDTVREPKEEQDGYYKFDGWDTNEEEFPVNEDTVITGAWTFHPLYKITTEVINGTITDDIIDIEQGEIKTVNYLPDPGYQLKTLIVDDEEKSIREYPDKYTFTDINEDHEIIAEFELIPVLKADKRTDKDIVNAGDTVTYTVTVSQTAEGAEARNVIIEDTLPAAGIKLDPESFDLSDEVADFKVNGNYYSFRIPSLTESITYSYKAVTDDTNEYESLVNTVTAKADNVTNAARDEAKIEVVIPVPEVEKLVNDDSETEAEYGDTVHFKIIMRQTREHAVLRNAKLTDEIPEGLYLIKESVKMSDEDAVLEVGDDIITVQKRALADEMFVEFDAKVTNVDGTIENVAVLFGDDVEEVEDSADINIPLAELDIEKYANKKKAYKGNTVKYTLDISQDGAKAINTVVTDKIPAGLKLDKSSVTCSKDAKITVSGSTLKVRLKDVFKGRARITFKAKVTKNSGKIKNTAVITADNVEEDDESSASLKVIKHKAKKHRTSQTGDKIIYSLLGIISLITILAAGIVAKKRFAKR